MLYIYVLSWYLLSNLIDIVIISHFSTLFTGDGIIFEVYNGLMKRDDFTEAIKIPLAIIPGGSGNLNSAFT